MSEYCSHELMIADDGLCMASTGRSCLIVTVHAGTELLWSESGQSFDIVTLMINDCTHHIIMVVVEQLLRFQRKGNTERGRVIILRPNLCDPWRLC